MSREYSSTILEVLEYFTRKYWSTMLEVLEYFTRKYWSTMLRVLEYLYGKYWSTILRKLAKLALLFILGTGVFLRYGSYLFQDYLTRKTIYEGFEAGETNKRYMKDL